MSLLMNEEFAIYQLRSGYLNTFKDGIGERLITLNPALFNTPAFRAAGYAPDPAEIKRTYSPPIPTAVTSEYFQAPPQAAATSEENEEGTILTGHGSNDTIGPTLHTRRRRRKEQEEDDSSELSDESEEEEKTDARKIRFNKMPVRIRSGSSPARPSKLKDEVIGDDLETSTISPAKPPYATGPRRGSLSAIDTIKQRARRDTATSSEMSSENEDSIIFRRQKISNVKTARKQSLLLSDIIQEEEGKLDDSDLDDEDLSGASDISDLEDTADADILLNIGAPLAAVDTLESSPPMAPPPRLPVVRPESPRRKHTGSSELARLPQGRPVSFVQSVSLLSKAFKGDTVSNGDLLQRFAPLSGKGESSPLWVKVLFPGSSDAEAYVEVPTRRLKDNVPPTVAEFIGVCLWRYKEEDQQPPLTEEDTDVNRWVVYMVDSGEVDFDFPHLPRNKPLTDFTTRNNKPGRLRPGQRPWDEFAIVKANERQVEENERLTPDMSAAASRSASVAQPERSKSDTSALTLNRQGSDVFMHSSFIQGRNPITGGAMRNNSVVPLMDNPTTTQSSSRNRTGVAKTLQIFYTDQETFQTRGIGIETTTDTYIAEVFRQACEKFGLSNRTLFVLKIRNTALTVPEDRTVEALGDRTQLDLQRRRFIGIEEREGAQSPASESPNAPLLLSSMGTPTKGKKKGFALGASKPAYDVGAIGFHQLGPGGKRYQVLRRQPLSFAPSHPKVIALDGEYIHIMPAANMDLEGGGGGAAVGKTTSVHLRDVIGCKVARKHPKLVRILVYREKETKRYEFDAGSRAEAAEIVEEIRKGVERSGGQP